MVNSSMDEKKMKLNQHKQTRSYNMALKTITITDLAGLPEVKDIMDNKDLNAMPNKQWQPILKEHRQDNGEYEKVKLLAKVVGMAEFGLRPPMSKGVGTSNDSVVKSKARKAGHSAMEVYAKDLKAEGVQARIYFRSLDDKTGEDVKK